MTAVRGAPILVGMRTHDHPYYRTTAADLQSFTRAQLIDWLQWNDPNGEYDGLSMELDDAQLAVIQQIQHDIGWDINEGKVPEDVRTFAQLHDHVDANEYGGACELVERIGLDAAISIFNVAQAAVDEWLASGRRERKDAEQYVSTADLLDCALTQVEE